MKPLVIGWWGPQLFVLGPSDVWERQTLAEGADPLPVILAAIAGRDHRSTSARIIYQPDELATHEVDPAFARRRRRHLRRTLEAEYPAVTEAEAIWSVTGPAATGEARPATLHLEIRSPLPELATRLARAGLTVEGAWPLAALAGSFAAAGSVNLAAVDDRGLVAWNGPGGESGVEHQAGEGFAEALLTAWRGARARFDETARPPGWLVVEDGPSAHAIREAVGGTELRKLTMAEFLGGARRLPPGDTANFLPPPPWHARRNVRRKIAAAAAFAGLAGAVGLGWSRHLDREQRRQRQSESLTRRRQLQVEAAAGLARRNEARQLEDEWSAVEAPVQHHGEWLLVLARATPKAMVLLGLTTDHEDFAIMGRWLSGADSAGNSLAAWRRQLATPEAPWTLAEVTAPAAGPEFAARGSFRTERFPGNDAKTLADLAARLAEARSRLPPASGFDARPRPWGPRWTIVRQASDHRSGWEIRHYDLAYDRPRLDDWPDIVDRIKACCAEPGLTIDRLALASEQEGGDAFSQAELSLTVRLRR